MAGIISRERIEGALTYPEFKKLVAQLVAEGKTSGPKQTEDLIEYTKLNQHRTERNEKTVKLLPALVEELNELQRPLIWVVLLEAWCGDGAQNIPVMAMMADASPNIELRILLRDENPDIMDQFLTNGGRSVPKLICLDAESLEVLGCWGPRPEPARQLFLEHKKIDPPEPHEEFVKRLHLWYAKNKGIALQEEFIQLIPQWANKEVSAYLCS